MLIVVVVVGGGGGGFSCDGAGGCGVGGDVVGEGDGLTLVVGSGCW